MTPGDTVISPSKTYPRCSIGLACWAVTAALSASAQEAASEDIPTIDAQVAPSSPAAGTEPETQSTPEPSRAQSPAPATEPVPEAVAPEPRLETPPPRKRRKKKAGRPRKEGSSPKVVDSEPPPNEAPTFADKTREGRVSIFYRMDLERTDNGLEKSATITPNRTTDMTLAALKTGLVGEYRKDLDYNLLVDLTQPDDPIELAKATWRLNRFFSVIVGKDYVNQGGFEVKHWNYENLSLSSYAESWLPLPLSTPTFGLTMNVLGTVTLQVARDLTKAQVKSPPTATSEKPLQPATTLEYLGVLGHFSPLLQMGFYNHGTSRYLAFGLQISAHSSYLYGNYVMDFRNAQFTSGASTKKLDTVYNSLVVQGELAALKAFRPFFKVDLFAVQEPDDADFKLKDRSFNSPISGNSVLDDNATHATIGWRSPIRGEELVPYLAMDVVTGTFESPVGSGKTEQRRASAFKLGVAGKL